MIEPNGSKVVYWIGAGASYQSLPIVREMPAAFTDQANQLKYYHDIAVVDYLRSKGLERYQKYLNDMGRWSRQFGSIDTYARALFLLGEKREKQLAELKLHIAMYFLLAQALPKRWVSPRPELSGRLDKADLVDTRYMALLALLLNEHGGLSKRVNIISWNYDLQLEFALMWFREHESMKDIHDNPNIHIFPSLFGTQATYYTTPSIIKLNGVAGHAKVQGKIKALYADLQFPSLDQSHFVKALFDEYADAIRDGSETLSSMADTLTFAWEANETSQMAIKLSKRVLIEAETLVIIGYSFPSFNRKVDRELYAAFHSDRRTKQVVLQNGAMEANTFRKIMGYPDTPTEHRIRPVEVETNLNQFHVPASLF